MDASDIIKRNEEASRYRNLLTQIRASNAGAVVTSPSTIALSNTITFANYNDKNMFTDVTRGFNTTPYSAYLSNLG